MIIRIASGKNETGKTSLIAAFTSLAESKVLFDADVDAADLHLIMSPQVFMRADFKSGDKIGGIKHEICHTFRKWKINRTFWTLPGVRTNRSR